ncbi:hypothetical protein IscW_ISCW023007 [Ixodes scapularis]|uniref:Uncharacterized protein n=1 Tax=Ixodes scapularis TaxID=6945 RepID=B7QJN8_IXOSC|nr:hypothetical protein IscW_ISCW023007 [Ixodes scapularis]|eukprot:XP_002415395.1 hypothetical protein IscW_ISCW023007 [Ixodes scapularis]
MLEALSFALVLAGVYCLLLLFIITGWTMVWDQFLSKYAFLQELFCSDVDSSDDSGQWQSGGRRLRRSLRIRVHKSPGC